MNSDCKSEVLVTARRCLTHNVEIECCGRTFLQSQLHRILDSRSLNLVPAAIDAELLPLLKSLLAQEIQQSPTKASTSTVISCMKLLTDKPLGARSVLADPELYSAVLDVAFSIMSTWCLQQKQSSTDQPVSPKTCSDAMVTVANLLSEGELSASSCHQQLIVSCVCEHMYTRKVAYKAHTCVYTIARSVHISAHTLFA
jgi:hypothetical protein